MLLEKYFLALVIICLFILYAGIRKVARDSGAENYNKSANLFLFFSFLWIFFLWLLSSIGFFSDFSGFPPRIMIVLVVPLITVIFFLVSKGIFRFIAVIPVEWLIYLQAFRVVVELLLFWMYDSYLLPRQMTFEGFNFDILVGLSAPFIAYFYKAGKLSIKQVLVWNFAGLALLLNVVTIAILSLPTEFRVFMQEPSNSILARFPFILLPGILVPLAYTLHLMAIKKLLMYRPPTS